MSKSSRLMAPGTTEFHVSETNCHSPAMQARVRSALRPQYCPMKVASPPGGDDQKQYTLHGDYKPMILAGVEGLKRGRAEDSACSGMSCPADMRKRAAEYR